jgi:hypothetical protein
VTEEHKRNCGKTNEDAKGSECAATKGGCKSGREYDKRVRGEKMYI